MSTATTLGWWGISTWVPPYVASVAARQGLPAARWASLAVPLATLLDYLEAGQPLSEFLDDFPTVTREQAVAALEQAKEALLARARPA
jgi:hypothetical protein